jgi:hypothetical protein
MLPHKEYRFIFVVVPLLIVIAAGVAEYLTELSEFRRWKGVILAGAIASLIVVSGCGFGNRLPYETCMYLRSPLMEPDNVLRAYSRLAQSGEAGDVLDVVSGCCDTGGFYYLHRDVRILFGSSGDGIDDFVMYIISRANWAPPREFKEYFRIGDVRVWVRNAHRRRNRPPPPVNRNVKQFGIDGRFPSGVKPFL